MERRRYCAPILVGANKDVLPLERVPLEQRVIDERWLQDLLRAQPRVLPIAEIEPAFAPAVTIGWEVSTRVGQLDNLYISPAGYPTVVETKLWRNPEARREVVAQILDYAKELATWTYADLEKVARAYTHRYLEKELGLFELVRSATDEPINEATFADAVSANLRRARILLLIVGDGIRESVEDLVAFLQQTPQFHFTLALVELLLYKPPKPAGTLLVVPQVVARTREITRAVVRVEGTQIDSVRVTVDTEPDSPRLRVTLAQEDFLFLLAQQASAEAVQFARELIEDAPRLGLMVDWGQSSFMLKMRDPGGSGELLSFLVVGKGGTAYPGSLPAQLDRLGLPAQIGSDYLSATAQLLPNCQATPSGWSRMVFLTQLKPHYEAFRRIILDTRARIEQSCRERAEPSTVS